MLIIGITGGTGSGKTTLTSKLIAHFSPDDINVISQDSYYKNTDDLSKKERIALNFDHPNAIDFDLLVKHLRELKNGQTIKKPTYSFLTHNRTSKTITISPKKIIIVEGILIFNDKRLLNLFSLTVFVTADAETRLLRRIKRDAKERGRSFEEVTKRYHSTLKPMHDKYIEPYKGTCEIVISTDSEHKNKMDLILETIRKKTK